MPSLNSSESLCIFFKFYLIIIQATTKEREIEKKENSESITILILIRGCSKSLDNHNAIVNQKDLDDSYSYLFIVLQFSVLYDARANTGINRTKVIDAVAKCVPSIHKVDLANPDISIMVQIVKVRKASI